MEQTEKKQVHYKKIENISAYVQKLAKDGASLIIAEKWARIMARRGTPGEKVVSWSVTGDGDLIMEKEAEVGQDAETGENDWIATKIRKDGSVLVDEYGNKNEWIISDTVFWGKEDIRNEKDNTLVKLEENSLLDKKKNSLAVKVGDTHYAVQRYTTQLTGNLETDQNIEVYEKDEKTQDILPEEEWVKDKDSTVKGSLKLIKAVSDKNIIADMQMDDGFKVIYNIEDGQSTSKYKSIGEFRDGKAFAVDMDNNIKIIDTSGKAINKNDIEVADYKENTDSLKSGTMTESELEKEKNQDIKKEGQTSFLKFENEKKDCFKLYSLIKEDVIKGTWKDVKFVGNDFVLLQNEDDKYGVIDKDGKTVVEFGEFSKDELLNASYCNSGITVVKQNGNKNDVYYYQTAKEVKKSFFEANKKIILFAGIGVAILLVILCVIIALKKKAAAKAEEKETAGCTET